MGSETSSPGLLALDLPRVSFLLPVNYILVPSLFLLKYLF